MDGVFYLHGKYKKSRFTRNFPGGTVGKESTSQWRRHKRCEFNPWVRKIPQKGNGNSLKYSFLENSMDRGTWWVTVHGVARSPKQLSNWAWARTHTHRISIQFLKLLSLLFLSETQTEMSEVNRSRAQKNSLSGSSNVSVINIQMEHIKTRLRRTLSFQRIQRICWDFHALKNGCSITEFQWRQMWTGKYLSWFKDKNVG